MAHHRKKFLLCRRYNDYSLCILNGAEANRDNAYAIAMPGMSGFALIRPGNLFGHRILAIFFTQFGNEILCLSDIFF